ncbi:MAG TPA: peroxidase-related enzyme, partial [Pyrinomonadaceae bacterium]|nr:peroxidase-related enzyme [Pyrinomonadaceae bacterium]
MSFLREVEVPDSFAPFVAFRESMGFVPKLFRAQTLLPRIIEAEAQIAGSILFNERKLTRTQKECILLTLAASRRNTYCVTAHYHSLRTLGLKENQIERLIGGHRGAGLPGADEALLDFALKLGRFPASLGQEDIAELRPFGFTDEGILEAVLMTALTNFLCCLSTGLGVTSDFPPLQLGVDPGFKGPASHKGSGVVDLQGRGPYLSSV